MRAVGEMLILSLGFTSASVLAGPSAVEDCRAMALAEGSESPPPDIAQAATRCMIYVRGVADAISLVKQLDPNSDLPVCLPTGGVNLGEIAAMVGGRSVRDPAAAELSDGGLVLSTLALAHRCPK